MGSCHQFQALQSGQGQSCWVLQHRRDNNPDIHTRLVEAAVKLEEIEVMRVSSTNLHPPRHPCPPPSPPSSPSPAMSSPLRPSHSRTMAGLSDLDFGPGLEIERLVAQRFKCQVSIPSSSSDPSFLLVVSFGRSSVSLLLQSCIGGAARDFHVTHPPVN